MDIVAVIPARYKSSRFPGKPLADILGKPMIWYVYNQAKKVSYFSEVFVATDDDRIFNKCTEMNIKVIKTSEEHKTGTDRVAEVAKRIKADLYVNIQGDEPLIESKTIEAAIKPFLENQKIDVTNLMTKINKDYELIDSNIPKVVVNKNNEAIFLSRLPIPYPKNVNSDGYYKQVCVYGFTPESLKFFSETDRGKIEKIEDIEILRFIENRLIVKFVEVKQDTVAVDTKRDLEIVRKIMTEKNRYNK